MGSTDIAAELEDRRWKELLRRHHNAIRQELRRFRGREVDTAGDGFFASFGEPAGAIRCACAAQDALRELGVEIRAGIHTGECEVIGKKVGGMAVHLASRVLHEAAPGEVLVTSTTKQLIVGSGIGFTQRGTHRLKGVPDEWDLYAVLAIDGEPRAPVLSSQAAAERRAEIEPPPLFKRRPRLVAATAFLLLVATGVAIAVGLSSSRSPGQPQGLEPNQVVEINPSGGLIAAARMPPIPQAAAFRVNNPGIAAIAVGEGGVWAIGTNGIARIDPETRATKPISIPHGATDVAVAPGNVWVGNGVSLYRIDPATESVQTIALPVTGLSLGAPFHLAVGAGAIWVAAEGPGELFEVDDTTAKLVRTVHGLGTADDVAYGAGSVWVADSIDGEVDRIDPRNGRVIGRIPVVGQLTAIAADDQGVWVLTAQSGTVTPINPAIDKAGSSIRVGRDPTDIAIALGAEWVTNRGDGTLTRIDPVTGTTTTVRVTGPVAAVAGNEQTRTLWVQLVASS